MSIPFIRQDPSGKRSMQEIVRGRQVDLKAAEFIDHEGRFLIEILPDGRVHLMAIIDLAGGCKQVAEQFCPNGPELPDAVDRLVEAAYPQIPIKLLVPANAS